MSTVLTKSDYGRATDEIYGLIAWIALGIFLIVVGLLVYALVRYRERAPHARLAVPATEHFDPLLFALGAAQESDAMEQLSSGFRYSNLSLASFAFVPNGDR